MSANDEFDMEEYAETAARNATLAAGLMEYWYELLQDYRKTLDDEAYADTPVSKEYVEDQFDAERYQDLRSTISNMSAQSLGFSGYTTLFHREVSEETEKHIDVFSESMRDAKAYRRKIRDTVEQIQEYDEDFGLRPDS